MQRKPIVGISMKTYKNHNSEMIKYAKELKDSIKFNNDIEVIVFPSMGTLYPVSQVLKNSNIGYGAQNMGPVKNGAYTGELSIESLIDLKAGYVELGHAERRKLFNETNDMISNKVKLALDNNIKPVVCIGEPKILNDSKIKEYLKKQIQSALSKIKKSQINKVIFAYEPVWAIGGDNSANFKYVAKVHNFIRNILIDFYGEKYTESTRIIYGGSVSSNNAKDILNSPNVDGVFVGRFGHDVNQFLQIINLAK